MLRFEDIVADGATVSVAPGDGARLASPVAVTAWALTKDQPAQVSVRLVAPPGDSFLNVFSHQLGRTTARAILLPLAGTNPGHGAPRKDYATDARGQPIVRMQSDPGP